MKMKLHSVTRPMKGGFSGMLVAFLFLSDYNGQERKIPVAFQSTEDDENQALAGMKETEWINSMKTEGEQ